MEIDYCQHAWLWLESEHPLEICLILPCGAVDHCGALVVSNEVPMDVAGYENIRYYRNDQPVLGLGREGGLPTPRWS